MTQEPYQNPNDRGDAPMDQVPEPLPREVEPPLRELDLHLADLAAHVARAAPEGLEQRVFAASVADLPRAAVPAGGDRLRLVPAPTRRSRRRVLKRSAWSQLALAASLGLAFVLTSVFMPDRAVVVNVAAAAELDWLEEEPIDEFDGAVASLLDTATLSSLDEVTGELETLLDDLGM